MNFSKIEIWVKINAILRNVFFKNFFGEKFGDFLGGFFRFYNLYI